MRSVGREPPLLGDVRLEPVEHAVEGVGQLAELVVGSFQLDPVVQGSGRRHPGGGRDAGQGREHAAGEDPATQQAEHQQERQHPQCGREEDARPEVVGVEGAHEVRQGGHEEGVRPSPQEEHPDRGEQQDAGHHQEPGVAEGELEPDAQPWCPIHGSPPSRAPSTESMR